MGDMKIHEFIEENIDTIRVLVHIGAVPATWVNYYQIYSAYKTTEKMRSKMDRYYFLSTVFKVRPVTIQTAVKTMERRIKPQR